MKTEDEVKIISWRSSFTGAGVGAKIRGRFEMLDRQLDPKRRWLITFGATIEIEGHERPALVARWLSVWMPAEEGGR